MKITDHTATKKMDKAVLSEKYHVFLGGSCGGRKSPTTWRKEVAIPLLTENAITFFNPQVDTWTHDLIYKENKAKENSDWLLFMLESSTRGIVSLVEVAYLVGIGRSVVFVLQDDREKGKICIKEDRISALESNDITASQQTLSTIIGKHENCRYFSVLEKGLHHVIDGMKRNHNGLYTPQQRVGEKKEVLQEMFQKLTNLFGGKHNEKRRPTALRIPRPFQRYSVGIIAPDNTYGLTQMVTDRLSKLGLTPSKDSIYTSQGSDAIVMDSLIQCQVIIVIIPSTALACEAMCKAAYMLSQKKPMVMCVQSITQTIDNGNTLLTASAVDDFNRARTYLKDMAASHSVPVYSAIDDAMDLAANQLHQSIRSQCKDWLTPPTPEH